MSRTYLIERPPPSADDRRRRITPPRRLANLRRGGGRKDTSGWTEQKRKTNRRRFNQLRPFIKTGVTVVCPTGSTWLQLKAIDDCCRNFCREKAIPARAVWEGPGPHFHIALGCPFSDELEMKWRARLEKRWRAVYGLPMRNRAFLWKPDIEGQKIASYLSKTRDKRGRLVKGRPAWLTFAPCWETGYRSLVQAQSGPALARPGRPPASPERKSPYFPALYSVEVQARANQVLFARLILHNNTLGVVTQPQRSVLKDNATPDPPNLDPSNLSLPS